MTDYERLSTLDATFVYAETPSAPMHVGMLGVFEDRGVTEDALCRHVASRLHLFPRLRQKLAFVPYDQGHPVWVDDEQFDVGEHIRVTTLPRDDSEARRLTARVMSISLPRNRPLWEMRLFAMTDQRVGLILKIHHCLLDGVSAAHLVTVLFDFQSETRSTPPKRWAPSAMPSPRALLADAMQDQLSRVDRLRQKAREWKQSPHPARALYDRVAEMVSGIAEFGQATLASERRASLSETVGPNRRFATLSLPLAEVKAAKNAAGCKLNDVALALVAGGVGRLLRSRGVSTVDTTVKAVVPVSRRRQGAAVDYGNKVSLMALDLPVGDLPPEDLLRAVGEKMVRLKGSRQADGAEVWMTLAEHTPPAIVSLISRAVGQQRLVDLVVTNVPGPAFPLYLLGGKMLEVYPFVPLFGATSLGVAVASYDGRLYFGLSGDWDAMPDLEVAGDGIEQAFDDLRTVQAAPRPTLAVVEDLPVEDQAVATRRRTAPARQSAS